MEQRWRISGRSRTTVISERRSMRTGISHGCSQQRLRYAVATAEPWRGGTGTWRSLVAHLTGGQGVVGSNPAVPTACQQAISKILSDLVVTLAVTQIP
jgi:hypothetical protein